MNPNHTVLSLLLLCLVPNVHANSDEAVPDSYIVVLKEGSYSEVSGRIQSGERVEEAAKRLLESARQATQATNQSLANSSTGAADFDKISFTYTSALKGFAAQLSTAAVERLRADPDVAFIEPDYYQTVFATQQNPANWGLDRIDQRDLPLDNEYVYDDDGMSVHAYVIDTGIQVTHSEFTGRIGNGWDFIDNDSDPNDCRGHGTHVAGILGGTTYGVAKEVTLHGVRVFDCGTGDTSNSVVIAGIDWVVSNHLSPAVANLSLGGSVSSAIDSAVGSLVSSGVTTVVSAGNQTDDACSYSPARVSTALTVGSSTSADLISSFSNYGDCVDLFAPGSSITSSWNDGGSNEINGTSMAAPHVAGVAALYLENNPTASPASVNDAILDIATANKIDDGSLSDRPLLYSSFESTPSTNLDWLPAVNYLLLN